MRDKGLARARTRGRSGPRIALRYGWNHGFGRNWMPDWLQRRIVKLWNPVACAIGGHNDITYHRDSVAWELQHLGAISIVPPPESHCSNCSKVLTACVQPGHCANCETDKVVRRSYWWRR